MSRESTTCCSRIFNVRRPSLLIIVIAGVFFAFQGARAQAPKAAHTTWSDYGGGADSSQYSALSQINRSNVATLQIAWTYPTEDSSNYLFNPVMVDGVLYVLAKNNAVVALDAATGKEIWVH